jgi:hypothetical protein
MQFKDHDNDLNQIKLKDTGQHKLFNHDKIANIARGIITVNIEVNWP